MQYGSEAVMQTLRCICRRLWRDRSFGAGVIVTLALGISANLGLFAIVNAFLFHDRGVVEPDRLVSIRQSKLINGSIQYFPMSFGFYETLRKESTRFDSVAAYAEFREVLSGKRGAQVVLGEFVTPQYFETLGVELLVGSAAALRGKDGASAPAPAVISERLWRTQYQGASDVIGQVARVNKIPLAIVGVVPDRFRGLVMPAVTPTDIWVPHTMAPVLSSDNLLSDILTSLERLYPRITARLKTGVTVDEARAEIGLLARRVALANHLREGSLRVDTRRLTDEMINPNFDGYAAASAAGAVMLSGLVLVAVCDTRSSAFAQRWAQTERRWCVSSSPSTPRWHWPAACWA
jgi:hypothetical protein